LRKGSIMQETREVPQTERDEVQEAPGGLTATEEKILEAAVKIVRDRIQGLTEPFQRLVLERALGTMGDEGAEQEAEKAMGRLPEAAAVEIVTAMMHGRPSLRAKLKAKIGLIEDGALEEEKGRFRLDKARGEVVPLVKWLLSRSFSEKLTGLAISIIDYSDTRDAMRNAAVYQGDIYEDLVRDWSDEISRALEDAAETGAVSRDLQIASYVMALETARA